MVATPGPLRVLIEVVLHVAVVVGAWAAWTAWQAALSTVVVIVSIVAGILRTRWLLRRTSDVTGGSV